MPLLTPDVYFPHITDISGTFFAERGLRLIILDVDNTLTSHDNPTPFPGVQDWIDARKAEGLTLAILSNNTPERVAPFAEKIGLSFVANAAKPLTFGLTRACHKYGFSPKETCIIGDQLFTDMLGGNLKPGVTSVLVRPWEPEKHGFLAFKRRLEAPILRRYFSRQESVGSRQ